MRIAVQHTYGISASNIFMYIHCVCWRSMESGGNSLVRELRKYKISVVFFEVCPEETMRTRNPAQLRNPKEPPLQMGIKEMSKGPNFDPIST